MTYHDAWPTSSVKELNAAVGAVWLARLEERVVWYTRLVWLWSANAQKLCTVYTAHNV